VCVFYYLSDTDTGVIDRDVIRQFDQEAVVGQQGDGLFGQDAVLEYTAAQPDTGYAMVCACLPGLLQENPGQGRVKTGRTFRRRAGTVKQ
jgi:hypothetical protein